MSLLYIAWRSILQRGLPSLLTSISMALGVLLVVVVLTIHGVVADSFRNSAALGYNMIVGKKGSSLELTLNTVYYLSKPNQPIPYEYYLEFVGPQQRAAEYEHSYARQSHAARWNTAELDALAAASGSLSGLSSVGSQLCLAALAETDEKRMGHQRDGKFGAQQTALAIPVCLGDYFGRFRVVATTPGMFDDLTYGDPARNYEFAQGRNFQQHSSEHGYFEAVVGATVAREMKVEKGHKFSPTHGGAEGDAHDQEFTVVGILKPTGTPNDRAVFINLDGFYLMEKHSKPLENDEGEEVLHSEGGNEPLPIEQREVTAILVRTKNPMFAIGMTSRINKGDVAQAATPIQEIFKLFDAIVTPFQYCLLLLTGMICLVSGISILVSIYNSMSDRRHEIAVMRALGASRWRVGAIIIFEATILALGGGALGWLGAHALNALASSAIAERTGVTIGFFSIAPPIDVLELLGFESSLRVWPELLLVPGLIFLAIIVGFLPALSAYRTDVAKSLGT